LVEANLQLVATIAERYPRDKMHLLDLIQEGNRGLLPATQTLGETGVDNFPIHATPSIERAISEAFATTRLKMIPPHLM
jgi:RNA polymerase primary sigma factor